MDIGRAVRRIFPETFQDTLLLFAFGFMKVPLISFVRPRILEINDDTLRMMIPLRRRTKNHLGSMYFGSLMIGADVAAAYYAVKLIWKRREKVDFVFKSSTGNFLKRPMGDVVFSCTQGQIIRDLVERAIATGERVDALLNVTATVPSISPEVVAEMTMVLSLKKRKK